MEQYLEQPASRLRFLRQLGVSVAAGLGGAAVMSRPAFAGAPIAHGPGDHWAPISHPAIGDMPFTPYCCPNNTNCIGTCPPNNLLFYCSCASPYCECHGGGCYPAPC